MNAQLSLRADAEERYRGAQERAELALESWIEAGRPFTIVHANRTVGVHPLYRALTEAELHAERMRRAVVGKKEWFVPRPTSEVDEVLEELSPAARLRLIESEDAA